MLKSILFIATLFLMSCGTTTYYVVRHAEKAAPTANMTSDVPLSEEGKQRAEVLKDVLSGKKIQHIYSTNTIRTTSTAKPLSEAIAVPIQVYDPKDSFFAKRVKALPKGNVLIVGHSNTVDDIVYGITGRKLFADLNDNQYGDLFIIVRKGKKKFEFTQSHFGK
jgi:phosphohistidine phosphatase SixA